MEPTERVSNMKLRCGALFLLNAADAGITAYALQRIVGAYEANPLWAWVIAVCPWFFVTLKLVLGTVLIYGLYRSKSPWVKKYGSTVCIALYLGIVMQNTLLVLAVTTDMFL